LKNRFLPFILAVVSSSGGLSSLKYLADRLLATRLRLMATAARNLTSHPTSDNGRNLTTTSHFATPNPYNMPVDTSSLAAKSAQHSLKRSRILYDVNPQATFLPTVDPTILNASIARRKRRIQPQLRQNQQESGSSNALSLVSENGSMKPLSSSASANPTNTALAVAGGANDNLDQQKPEGILTVSFVMAFAILILLVRCIS
jgi:hypothetical protein